mmetsp:Transcript_3415/g.7799  ORF Transcript_3415/g.7799 Transcript_3415/m.7799 type:complete len:224 (-) Transcript_3415:472-1143(-)
MYVQVRTAQGPVHHTHVRLAGDLLLVGVFSHHVEQVESRRRTVGRVEQDRAGEDAQIVQLDLLGVLSGLGAFYVVYHQSALGERDVGRELGEEVGQLGLSGVVRGVLGEDGAVGPALRGSDAAIVSLCLRLGASIARHVLVQFQVGFPVEVDLRHGRVEAALLLADGEVVLHCGVLEDDPLRLQVGVQVQVGAPVEVGGHLQPPGGGEWIEWIEEWIEEWSVV